MNHYSLYDRCYCHCFWHDEMRAYFILANAFRSCIMSFLYIYIYVYISAKRVGRSHYRFVRQITTVFLFVLRLLNCIIFSYSIRFVIVCLSTQLWNEITFQRIIWALIAQRFFCSFTMQLLLFGCRKCKYLFH